MLFCPLPELRSDDPERALHAYRAQGTSTSALRGITARMYTMHTHQEQHVTHHAAHHAAPYATRFRP